MLEQYYAAAGDLGRLRKMNINELTRLHTACTSGPFVGFRDASAIASKAETLFLRKRLESVRMHARS